MLAGGCLIPLPVFGRRACHELHWKCITRLYITCLLHVFSSFPSILFPFSRPPLFLTFFIFHFCLLPCILHSPPSFKRSPPILSLASRPPLPSSAFHVPSDWFLCLSNFSSNAARAAFQPTASGAASLGALLMRLRAGKPRKCQVEGSAQQGLCGAWSRLASAAPHAL